MSPNDKLLQNICRHSDTLGKAQQILRLAQKRTGPGSGYELGAFTSGLPAVCAYIASKQLNNNNVTRDQAQNASCLKPSDFNKVFHLVQAAIGDDETMRSGKKADYKVLNTRYQLPVDSERLVDWAKAVERALLQSDNRFNPDSSLVKCAIFYWVCNVVTKPTQAKCLLPLELFAEQNKLQYKSLSKHIDRISSICSSLKARIQNETRSRPSSPVKPLLTTPRRSPRKTSLRPLPTRDSPTKRKAEVVAEPDQAKPDNSRENDMTVDVDMLDADETAAPETPSKKRRLAQDASTSLVNSRQLAVSPSKPKAIFPPSASPSKTLALWNARGRDGAELDDPGEPKTPRRTQSNTRAITSSQRTRVASPSPVRDVVMRDIVSPAFDDEDEDEDLHPPPRRRFRPAYLDYKQWYSRDPRLDRLWKEIEKQQQQKQSLRMKAASGQKQPINYGSPRKAKRTPGF